MKTGHMPTIKMYKNNGDVYGNLPCGSTVIWRRGHIKNIPDRRYKYVMVNCYRYRIMWVDNVQK